MIMAGYIIHDMNIPSFPDTGIIISGYIIIILSIGPNEEYQFVIFLQIQVKFQIQILFPSS